MPRFWPIAAMALAMALGVTAKGRDNFFPMEATTLAGKTTGTSTSSYTAYTLTTGQPALQYASIKVVVDITVESGSASMVSIALNFPTDTETPSIGDGALKTIFSATTSCTTGTIALTIDSTSSTTGTCSGTIKPANSMLVGSQKWSNVVAQTTPFAGDGAPNQWLLVINPNTPGASGTAATILLNSWSIIIDTQCVFFVSNSVNLATATISGASQTLTCNAGFTATSNPLTCGTSGPTAAACINGGGGVMTWGLNANPQVATNSSLITMNMLGRTIVASGAVHNDPNIGYMWLPNGAFATRVALGDLCTIVLTNAGLVYQWGYCGDPTALTASTTTSVSAQLVNLPGGALAVVVKAAHFTYAALSPGNQLALWGMVTSTSGPTNTGNPYSDNFCGFTFQATPTKVSGLPGSLIADFALAINRVAVVTIAGEIYAWGCNAYYSLGSTYTGSSVSAASALVVTTPTKISASGLPTSTVKAVVMGEYQTVALDSDGNVYYWGVSAAAYNWATSTTNGNSISVPAPTSGTAIATTDYIAPVGRDTTRLYTQISANRWTFGGLTTAGAVYTWGYTYYPGNVNGGSPTVNTFVGVLGRVVSGGFGFDDAIGVVDFGTTSRTISLIAIGGTFALALDTSGNVVQWGSLLTDDQLNGVTNWRWSSGSQAVRQLTIPSGDNVAWIAAGRDTAAALDARNGASGCPSVGSMLTSQDVAFVESMSDTARAKLVSGFTTVVICGSTNWVNTFLTVSLTTKPYSLTMPSFSNGVTIAITQFNKAAFVIASAYSPTGASIAAVGIVPLQNRLLLFLMQIDQMYLDSSMSSGNPMVVQVTVANLDVVYVYRGNYRNGKQLAGTEGQISNIGNVYTLSLYHTSAIAGYAPYVSPDGSNEALLGLLGLIALPVLCALGLYIWLWYRYTHTEAVVEAANPVAPVFMMEPQPIVAPSPAYIPAAYPAAPAYYV